MPKLSCFVVGEGAIALKCLQILWQADHNILGIYTTDRALNAWADEQGLFQAGSRERFRDWLLTLDYDYLFSINNSWIIPPEVIARPGTIINYHNSPLPKYAGLYATSWALLKGETQHAVSWHKVVTEIDAGAILKQPMIPIQPDDTALSLNTRCFEVAIESFAALIEALADDRAISFAQDLSQRSYFGLDDRPAAACLLSFDQRTQDLYNLVRALDFEPTHNPLGLAKIWLPTGVVGVGQASPISASNAATINCPAGQVLMLNEQGLQIATLDGALCLSRLTTLEGTPLDATMLSDRYGVRIGDVLPTLSIQMRQAMSQQNATICRYERTWVKQLTRLSPFVHPYLQLDGGKEIKQALHRYAIELPQIQPRSRCDGATSLPFAEADVWLLATFAAYCARLATASEFDLLLQTKSQRSLTPELFAQSVPIRVQTDQGEALTQFYDRFQAVLTRTLRLGSYARDVFARYPELQQEAKPLAVAIVLLPTPADLEFCSLNAAMALVAYENGDSPELVHAGALNDNQSEAIGRQLQSVITACLGNPDQPLQTLPLLTVAERQQILVEWNQTANPYPGDRCIHTLISAQVAKTPEAPAVRFGDVSLSYGELEQRSNQLAHWLVKLGIKPDDLVGLCLPRSVDLIVGLLGILKAGGAYVPIDPTYPVDRIAYLIEDSCPQIIITTEQLRSRLGHWGNAICFDDLAQLSEFSVEPVATQVTPQHLAYMIYTSGSTGKPKGVKIEHRSVVNHSWAVANAFELDCGDRILQSASISFDIAGEQIYPALLRGAEVVIRPDDLLESFDRFTRFIDSQAITVMILPTVFWHEWVAELIAFNQQVPPSLRLISVGTEKVLSTRLNQWQTVSAGRVTFFQGYGPTEATITCTLYKHDGHSFRTNELPPIGRPLSNTEIYILDPQLEPVPIGMVGELYVGGDGLARGYHQRPDLTAQQFIAHPFRDRDNARLYKTGDLARFQPDGQIVYCDRADHQIKLHGFRIELGEIEAALHECQGVKQSVVIVREAAGTRSLIAYVVPQPEQALTATHLQALLKQTLPSYMLPASIVLMSALPLTLNGKVDRQALPNPIVGQNEMAAIAPRDALERQLAQLWETVLGIQPTSITDDFFALGGHSLAAVCLADRIQTTFQQNLPLAVIFQAPTIEQFAAVLRQEKPLPSSALVALQPNGSQTPLFLFQGINLYRSLAVHLAPDRPVYGLSIEMMDNNGMSLTSIKSLAAHYIQEIRTVQPIGPYCLGGVSLGGLVALEVAQQLQANHQAIALLALFDTPAPNAFSLKPLPKRIIGHTNNLLKVGPNYVLRKLAAKLHQVNYKLLKLANRTSSKTMQYKFVREIYEEMRATYHPQVYSGRIALFLAMDRSDIQDSVFDSALVNIDPQFGWGNLAQGQLDIYEVPGDHLGILKEPQVKLLAQVLKRLLQDAV